MFSLYQKLQMFSNYLKNKNLFIKKKCFSLFGRYPENTEMYLTLFRKKKYLMVDIYLYTTKKCVLVPKLNK